MLADQKLTSNFRLSEFLRSDIAIRRGIDNSPDAGALWNIQHHLAPGMQRIRDLLANPGAYDTRHADAVFISSGFRCFTLNSAVGGSTNSQHLLGLAADFTAPSFGTPRDICQFLVDHADLIKFDQLIFEGQWTHVSFAAEPRKSVLTAHFDGGKATYTQGIS